MSTALTSGALNHHVMFGRDRCDKVRTCSGQTSVNSPKWTINAGIEQVIPLANGANIKIDAQTRYQSKVQTSYDFLPSAVQKGYTMSDVYLTYEAPDQKYYITGYVSNIERRRPRIRRLFRRPRWLRHLCPVR